jgi:predicted esterase
MEHHKFKIEKTAHVYTHGQITEGVRYLWFVTHGYGQLASNIIRKFEHLGDEHFVIAPEGLSRFYWNFKTNEIGANWMTKQDRLNEIDDYTRYLSLVFKNFKEKLPPSVKIVFLGFSQGCATQLRWITQVLPDFNHLILWAGLLPEDIDYQPFIHYFKNKKIHFLCGDEDEFIDDKRLKWHLDFAGKNQLPMKYHRFEGKHEILVDVLNDLIKSHF